MLNQAAAQIHQWVLSMAGGRQVELIGPTEATIYKVNDIYRKILYLKQENYGILIDIKNRLEDLSPKAPWFSQVMIQYDFA